MEIELTCQVALTKTLFSSSDFNKIDQTSFDLLIHNNTLLKEVQLKVAGFLRRFGYDVYRLTFRNTFTALGLTISQVAGNLCFTV